MEGGYGGSSDEEGSIPSLSFLDLEETLRSRCF